MCNLHGSVLSTADQKWNLMQSCKLASTVVDHIVILSVELQVVPVIVLSGSLAEENDHCFRVNRDCSPSEVFANKKWKARPFLWCGWPCSKPASCSNCLFEDMFYSDSLVTLLPRD